jgi:hypothetical protein
MNHQRLGRGMLSRLHALAFIEMRRFGAGSILTHDLIFADSEQSAGLLLASG